MNKTTPFDHWHDRHTISYRRLLVGLYREHLSMQFMAEEMEVSLPNLYNLHRRALASLKAHMTKPQARKTITITYGKEIAF